MQNLSERSFDSACTNSYKPNMLFTRLLLAAIRRYLGLSGWIIGQAGRLAAGTMPSAHSIARHYGTWTPGPALVSVDKPPNLRISSPICQPEAMLCGRSGAWDTRFCIYSALWDLQWAVGGPRIVYLRLTKSAIFKSIVLLKLQLHYGQTNAQLIRIANIVHYGSSYADLRCKRSLETQALRSTGPLQVAEHGLKLCTRRLYFGGRLCCPVSNGSLLNTAV
jgi:hypothetical protein